MDQIGIYRILEKIGEGGMGEVFKAIDTMLEREVAIKVVRPEFSQREDIVQRFRSEAVALGRLSHPNIATVHAFARDGERHYMVLEFVEGESLARIIARHGRLPWRNAARYACSALSGLEHAHRLNVIHRDVKPANILVAKNGMVKIMDFGIARILERARQTRTGGLVCTLEYASPEQIKGLEVDARSDVYSLGLVLYEMLTGRMPFDADTEYALMKAHTEVPPIPPRVFTPEIPQELELIVLKALAKKPAERFASASAFFQALHRLLEAPRTNRHGLLTFFSRLRLAPWWARGAAALRWMSRHLPATLSVLALLLSAAVVTFLFAPPIGERSENAAQGGAESASMPTSLPVLPQRDVPVPSPLPLDTQSTVPTPLAPSLGVPAEGQRPVPAEPRNPAPSPGGSQATRTQAEKRPTSTMVPKTKPNRSKSASRSGGPDDDAEYWRSLERSSGEAQKSGSAAKPSRSTRRAQEDENARYWREIRRDALAPSRKR